MTRRVLIVKLGALGDVATVLPAAGRLRDAGFAIDWLCGKSVEGFLHCYSWIRTIPVNDLILFGPGAALALLEIVRTWSRLTARHYELCAVLQYDPRYRLLTLPVSARRSLALDRTSRSLGLISERHHSSEFARILCGLSDDFTSPNAQPVPPDSLPQNPLPRGAKTRIALAPGGARNLLRDDPLRRWPIDAYVRLAAMLLTRGHEVVLTGSASDQWVSPHFQHLGITNTIGAFSIAELLAFFGSCHCVVTHDTGSLHLSALTSTSVVGIFGPTAPSKALPRRAGVVGLWGGERLACRPCYDGRSFASCSRNACLIAVTPERVAAAVDSLVEQPDSEWRIESMP